MDHTDHTCIKLFYCYARSYMQMNIQSNISILYRDRFVITVMFFNGHLHGKACGSVSITRKLETVEQVTCSVMDILN